MRKYGGLRQIMPITFLTFGAGYLAIIGFPGFAASSPRKRSSRPRSTRAVPRVTFG